MAKPRAIPGRIFVSFIIALALAPVVIWIPSPGKIADCSATIVFHVPEQLAQELCEIRYLPYGEELALNFEDFRDNTRLAERSGNDFECILRYSYNEFGWVFKRRIDTAPLPKQFSIWLLFDDGSWSRLEVTTPPITANGNREIILTQLH